MKRPRDDGGGIARKLLRLAVFTVIPPICGLLTLLLYPDPAFAYAHQRRMFEVRSDRPIGPGIGGALDDAARRVGASKLLRSGDRFRLFICNEPWRLALFARNTSLGGSADYATGNIYLREIDAGSNRIVIPQEWGGLADAEDRPLSYFIAHEAAHILTSRRFGRVAALRSPKWVTEGYADLVAKAGDFDLATNRELLRRGDWIVSEEYSRTGLYRRYHLMVAAMLGKPGVTLHSLFTDPPTEAEALDAARSFR